MGASAAGTGQVQAKNAETGARSGQSGTCRKAENVASVDEQFRIEKLDFSYLADIPVLEDLNMKLDQRPTAIIGQNGAGKTTLVKLLKGLLNRFQVPFISTVRTFQARQWLCWQEV